jgi:hypothetical protein
MGNALSEERIPGTRQQIDGHPCFASASGQHLFRHPMDGQ